MLVKIPIKICEYIKELSCYNNNYYKLPVVIDKHEYLYLHCQEDYESYDYYLGDLKDGKFIQDDNCHYPYVGGSFDEPLDYIVLDSEYKNVDFT